jgi:hypothetical protein
VLARGEAVADGEHPAADPVARLDDRHAGAHGVEIVRCGQPGQSGTGDDDRRALQRSARVSHPSPHLNTRARLRINSSACFL